MSPYNRIIIHHITRKFSVYLLIFTIVPPVEHSEINNFLIKYSFEGLFLRDQHK